MSEQQNSDPQMLLGDAMNMVLVLANAFMEFERDPETADYGLVPAIPREEKEAAIKRVTHHLALAKVLGHMEFTHV